MVHDRDHDLDRSIKVSTTVILGPHQSYLCDLPWYQQIDKTITRPILKTLHQVKPCNEVNENAYPVDDGVVEANVVGGEGVASADPSAGTEPTTLGVLELSGERPEALLEVLEVLTIPKPRGLKRLVVFVGEVLVLHYESLSYEQNAHRVPGVVIVGSELRRVFLSRHHTRRRPSLLHCCQHFLHLNQKLKNVWYLNAPNFKQSIHIFHFVGMCRMHLIDWY